MANEPRLIGVDPAPQATPRNPGQVRPTDNQVAESIWQRTAETNIRASQELEREQAANIKRTAAEQQAKIKQVTEQKTGGVVEGILGAVMGGLKTYQEVRSARAEAEKEQRDVASTAELTQFLAGASDAISTAQVELRDSLDEDGWLTVQRRLTDTIMGNPNLDPEDQATAIRWVYDNIENYHGDKQSQLYREHRDLQAQRVETLVADSRLDLLSYVTPLHNNLDPDSSQQAIGGAVGRINELLVANSNDLTLEEQLQFKEEMLNMLYPYVESNVFARQALDQEVQRMGEYQTDMAALEEAYAAGILGETPEANAQAYLNARAIYQTGVTGQASAYYADTDTVLETQAQRMENLDRIRELNTPEAQAVFGQSMGEMIVAYRSGTPLSQFGTYGEQVEQVNAQLETAQRERDSLRRQITTAEQEYRAARAFVTANERRIQILQNPESLTPEQQAAWRETLRMSEEDKLDLLQRYATAQATIQTNDQLLADLNRQHADREGLLRQYGLHNGLNNSAAFQEFWDTPEQAANLQGTAQIMAQQDMAARDFTSGSRRQQPTQAPAPLATIDAVQGSNQRDYTGIRAPFAAGTRVVVTSGQGWRGDRDHPAIDFGVPAGTPIAAPRSGRVTRNFWDDGGGGWVVSVVHEDGTESSYLHMQSQSPLEIGTVVTQGHELGRVGNTGESRGAHLDLRVKSQAGGSYDVNVAEWLGASPAETDFRGGTTVRSMGMEPNSRARPQNSGVPVTVTPEGATVLPSGAYIQDDTLYLPSGRRLSVRQGAASYAQEQARQVPQAGQPLVAAPSMQAPGTAAGWANPSAAGTYSNLPGATQLPLDQPPRPLGAGTGGTTTPLAREASSVTPIPASQAFNRATPLTGVMASNRRNAYPQRNDPANNYGYEFFAQNESARRALARVANNVGIPAQWLADVMALETGGSFRPDIPNKEGAVGLIQFHPSGGLRMVARDMNVSVDEARRRLAAMSFSEQMDYVEMYLSGYSRGDTQFVGRYDTVDRLALSVFVGQGRAFANLQGASDLRDRNVSAAQYTQLLGQYVGRRYYTVADQVSGRNIHTSYQNTCPTCQALRQSNSAILPHEAP